MYNPFRFIQKRLYPKKYLIRHGANIADDVKILAPFYECGEPYLLSIGSGSWVAAEVHFLTHDGSPRCAYRAQKIPTGTWRYGRITIGKNCFIGTNSILFPGISIGDNTIVGAGSVVTKSFPANVVVGGNPAHIICSLDDYAKKHQTNIVDQKNPNESLEDFLKRTL
jgi:acetyltransferase-like isoleucine patch superfamily enzyme